MTDTAEERQFYRDNPDRLIAHIKHLEEELNGHFDHNIIGSPEQALWKEAVTARMREMIKDDRIRKGMKTVYIKF